MPPSSRPQDTGAGRTEVTHTRTFVVPHLGSTAAPDRQCYHGRTCLVFQSSAPPSPLPHGRAAVSLCAGAAPPRDVPPPRPRLAPHPRPAPSPGLSSPGGAFAAQLQAFCGGLSDPNAGAEAYSLLNFSEEHVAPRLLDSCMSVVIWVCI